MRCVARGMYHTVNQLWCDSRGFSIATRWVLERQDLLLCSGPIANIIAAHFNQPAACNLFDEPIDDYYDMQAVKELIKSNGEADSFSSGFNTVMLYRALTYQVLAPTLTLRRPRQNRVQQPRC